MADINPAAATRPFHRAKAPSDGAVPTPAVADREALMACAELLFFAYRDFTSGPNAILDTYGFGRAHHRVLHFVHRRPGLRVAQLLDILRITKQSLARVLKQLIDDGFVEQQEGTLDRRERLLFVTAKGAALADRLSGLQVEQLAVALRDVGDDALPVVRAFLRHMIKDDAQLRDVNKDDAQLRDVNKNDAQLCDGDTTQTHLRRMTDTNRDKMPLPPSQSREA